MTKLGRVCHAHHFRWLVCGGAACEIFGWIMPLRA